MISIDKLNFNVLNDKDLELLLSMFRNSFNEEDYMATGEVEDLNTLNKILQNKNLIHYIAYDNQIPIGYCQIIYKSESKNFYTGAKINAISVIPEKRGGGVATKLFQYTIDSLRENKNIKNIYLDVVKDNYIAIKLYEKFNFQKAGELKFLFTKNNQLMDIVTYSLLV
jgi:ribosomal protein S18 acetylase RimI-like enzyme